jgi:hypothetical protein
MSVEARQALVSSLVFQDEHNGTATPTQRGDLLDPSLTDSGLVALLDDVLALHPFFEVTSVRRDHPTDDGPNGHRGGKAIDGWPLRSQTPGDYADAEGPEMTATLEAAARSSWLYQVGLGGLADTPGNAAIAGRTCFCDNQFDHVHLGARGA